MDKDAMEDELLEVIEMDNAISKANDRLNFVSQDKEFLRAYHLREMALSDWTTGINTATEKGIEKGKIEVAKNLLSKGMALEFIQETTGLDAETISSFAPKGGK